MKVCPTCQRVYPDDAGFCAADGTGLVGASMFPAAPSQDPRIGQRLVGRYEIRRVVADGGMGRVYEGIDKQTNSRIAVKVLHDDVSKDEVSLARFKREYEISASLPHDHIVEVLDFQHDPQHNVWLLVMEFLDGEELRVLLKREKHLPPERIIRMMSHVALGLDGAHARHFVHRDLKPDNLFLCGTRDGDVVKILDFGSVKDKNKDAKKLTVLGTTIGSPYYMAPEQAQGLETLDARADVFALGAIAYECMTGFVPFDGNNGPSILLAIMTKDPEPPSMRGRAAPYPPPQAIDDVIELALAKNPNIRTKTVGELADAIGHAYNLTGDHRAWATMSQSDLARAIADGRNRPVGAGHVEEAADPFASTAAMTHEMTRSNPPQVRTGGASVEPSTLPSTGPGAVQQRSMDAAFAAVRVADYDDANVAGVPQGRPAWIMWAVVAIAAVLVGGGATLFFLR